MLPKYMRNIVQSVAPTVEISRGLITRYATYVLTMIHNLPTQFGLV